MFDTARYHKNDVIKYCKLSCETTRLRLVVPVELGKLYYAVLTV